MTTIVQEGRVQGYRYAILEIHEQQYFWWVERPGGIAFWRGNYHSVPETPEKAKKQITETITKYGVSVK